MGFEQPSELRADHEPDTGWRRPARAPSLPEVYGSVRVPRNASFWAKLGAFIGPGYLVAVGYMDPGNWATDISAGSQFNHRLLAVVLISNFIAIFLQALAAKLGIVGGRDLAQACRDAYSRPTAMFLWIAAEIGIIACDLAEVIGAAIALNLLFGIPLTWGVVMTALDVLLVLALQQKGFRRIEAFVMGLIAIMMVIFAIELVYARPDWFGVLSGFVPRLQIVTHPGQLYLALGILGATVMPHNLYLHSAVVQTRQIGPSEEERRSALKLAYTDSTVALSLALFVNAAILILAASAFYRTGHHEVADIEDAYKMLTPLLGTALAAPLFAIALLASGQNSTFTGTLAGQIVLEGFTNWRLAPWARRLVSRGIAIVPAIIAAAVYGEAGTGKLLVFSQVVLSAQLSFAVIPLVQFTSDRRKMGPFVNGPWVKVLGWTVACVIAGLNVYLVGVALFGGPAG